MKTPAVKFNERGTRLMDQGKLAAAMEDFRKAIKAAPDWSVPWFNLGLAYKFQHSWPECLRYNQKAVALDRSDSGAWWNLGIAATALGDWREARRAWRGYGIEIADGDDPPLLKLGPTPIRIDPKGNPEVVWTKRLDPARAQIQNVPTPASGRRYQDIVLHDGEPVGFRDLGGIEVPVFNELELLYASPFSTYEATVEAPSKEDRTALAHLAEARGIGLDNWSAMRMLCKLCSEGKPHEDHHPQPAGDGPLVRYGMAAQDETDLYALFDRWRKERPDCLVHKLECLLVAE